MKPIDLYQDKSILQLFQAGIDQGYPSGTRPKSVEKLGGLIHAKEIKLKLPGVGTYYDVWWFPKSYGCGYDEARSEHGTLKRTYFGGATKNKGLDHNRVLEWHKKVLKLAGTRTRLAEPFQYTEDQLTYDYSLLFPPMPHFGAALSLERITHNKNLMFWHVFGLFPHN